MAEDRFGIVGAVLAATYRVESVVAESAFSLVYRAHHDASRTPVALELLELSTQNPQEQAAFLQLFRRVAEPVVQLSAALPNVRRALSVDAFRSPDGRVVPYWVLEWLEGMTLASLIEQRKRASLPPVTLGKLVRLLTPVARALERAHHFSEPNGPAPIVHGELTPENLFVAQVAGEEVVKILNLGSATLKSVASQIAGRISEDGSSPLAFPSVHAAPEQWAPQLYGPNGPWTDVWGLARCMVEVMSARPLFEGEPAAIRGLALDPKRRPTPRTQGIDLPEAIEAVFERALALEPGARQAHAGLFWDELLLAFERPEPNAPPEALELADQLEFDPSSGPRATAAPARVSAPHGRALATPARVAAGYRPPASASARPTAPGPMHASAVSSPHFVPDLELPPPSTSRRASGERPAAQSIPAPANVLELDTASMPAALALDLDLPPDEPRPQRSVSSQRPPALQANAPRQSSSPPSRSSAVSGSMAAVREPQAGPPAPLLVHARSSQPPLSSCTSDAMRVAPRYSRPPSSADVSAAFEASFVAKIEPPLLRERTLGQRLRPALAPLGAAILIGVFAPIYATATGEVLEIGGQRVSLLSGALLVLALGLAVREVTRRQQ